MTFGLTWYSFYRKFSFFDVKCSKHLISSDPLRREHVLEIVGRGTDLHSHTVSVSADRPRRHKKSVVRLYSTAVYNRQYVINMRGHRKRRLIRSIRAIADALAGRALNSNDIIGYR